MQASPRLLLDEIAQLASELGDAAATDLITTVRNQSGTSRLRILVVGSSGSGRFSLVNAILQQRNLLPTSPIPKLPLGVAVRHGESLTLEIVAKDGERTALPPHKLGAFLLDAGSSADGHLIVDVRARAELLTMCDLRIESLAARRSAAEWTELLAATDFVLLVLNATAMLSQQERDFVRDVLNPVFGLERTAILINQMDLVPEDERASIVDLVRTFLGPFESQPVILECSAAEAREALLAGNSANARGYDTLMNLVQVDLVERHAELRERAARQAVTICLDELSAAVARQNALLEMSQTEAKGILDGIDSRQAWLQARIQRTQHRISAFVATHIKEQLLREIEGFAAVFSRRLPDEISKIEDLTLIKRHLPGYIESVWSEFMNRQLIAVRSKLMDEAQMVVRMIETDLDELLEGQGPEIQKLLIGFNPIGASLRSFIMPKRGKHRAETIAKGLGLTGLVVFTFDPPLGLASLGAAHLLRRVFKQDIALADKKAIVASALSATHELEYQVKRHIEDQFGELARNLEKEIAGLYAEGVARVREFLAESMARHEELEARRAELGKLQRVTIPKLRRKLDHLALREAAR